ncbi:hypothetical protein [Candidatus Kuenenia stuttgartiensis]|uniref:hypothetical protein n=1 Tax=Kuenenia stuttgartiensis TaxID=174633 RepID=UPI00146B0DEC|nr:hypothetical protein [Candidatus Kuenenia stuttgartiensis]
MTSITVTHKTEKRAGQIRQKFQIEIKLLTDVIAADRLLDGVCVFITNHTEREDGGAFKAKPQSIVRAYRDKTKMKMSLKM